jgi:hypothetical protein
LRRVIFGDNQTAGTHAKDVMTSPARKRRRPGKRKVAGRRKVIPPPTPRKAAAAKANRPARAPDPLDEFIAGAAQALGLEIAPAWLPAVRANLKVTLAQAALVSEFALPDEAEPAPVFKA